MDGTSTAIASAVQEAGLRDGISFHPASPSKPTIPPTKKAQKAAKAPPLSREQQLAAEIERLRDIAGRAPEIVAEMTEALEDEDTPDCSDHEFFIASLVEQLGLGSIEHLAILAVGPARNDDVKAARFKRQRTAARKLFRDINEASREGNTAEQVVNAVARVLKSDYALSKHRPARFLGADVAKAVTDLLALIDEQSRSSSITADEAAQSEGMLA